jgi:hypothetical protein
MSVDEMTLIKMTVDKMTVDKLTVVKMACCHLDKTYSQIKLIKQKKNFFK